MPWTAGTHQTGLLRLCKWPVATLTNHHKLSGLRQHKLIILCSGGQSPDSASRSAPLQLLGHLRPWARSLPPSSLLWPSLFSL